MLNCWIRIGLALIPAIWCMALASQASAGLDRDGKGGSPVDRHLAEPVAGFGPAQLLSHGRALRQSRLELGAELVESPARALIRNAGQASARERLELAVQLSPELPLAYWALATQLFREGEHSGALTVGFRGLASVAQHLEARVWLLGCLLWGLVVVLIASSLCFIIGVGLVYFRDASHDLGDLFSMEMPEFARAALLLAFLLIPLALGEGVLGLVLGFLLLGMIYGSSSHRVILSCAAILLLLALFPMTQTAGRLFHALAADPVASSALAVARGHANATQLAVLGEAAESSDDVLALRALAVHVRRSGDEIAAREQWYRLLEREPGDSMALTVLGNLDFRAGRVPEAIEAYESARRHSASFELLYGLAQAYAKNFRIEDFEFVMAQAQRTDPERAAEFGRLGDPGFVVDPPFPMHEIRKRMWESADGMPLVGFVLAVLAPGWLGENVTHALAILLLIALVSLMLPSRYQQAGRCLRCGCTICTRCDDCTWSSEVCDSCHLLFSRPQAADRAARTLRIQLLQDREQRLQRVSTFFSLLVPGLAGLLVRRPDLAFLSINLFLGSLFFWFGRWGPVPEPLALGDAARLFFVLLSGLLFALYLFLLRVSFSLPKESSR